MSSKKKENKDWTCQWYNYAGIKTIIDLFIHAKRRVKCTESKDHQQEIKHIITMDFTIWKTIITIHKVLCSAMVFIHVDTTIHFIRKRTERSSRDH